MIIMIKNPMRFTKATCPKCGAKGSLTWVAIDPDDEKVKDALVCDCANCGARVSMETSKPMDFLA